MIGGLRAPGALAAAATAGCFAVLLASLGFEHLAGLRPCDLCYVQRGAHAAGFALGALALTLRPQALWRWAAAAGAAALAFGAATAVYQAGLEQGWWEGFTACSSPVRFDLSPEELIAQLQAAPIVRCDEVQWSMLGLSMAAWNVPLSAGLAALFGAAYASSSASQ
ncbi:MAG: disulfide bond formation protein B [Rubrimonas sp.]|uniref:disulfide bond formation protein B n=1 Tax=Rubrimonas sp. TaxID=2036015 RepID=UPI002FDE9C11